MRARQFLKEYTDLGTAKAEILKSINAIDPDTKDEDAREKAEKVLDKIYTVLNKNSVLDRFTTFKIDKYEQSITNSKLKIWQNENNLYQIQIPKGGDDQKFFPLHIQEFRKS